MVGHRLLFEKVKWWPGSHANKEQEDWDYLQTGKEQHQEKPWRLWEGVSIKGLLFFPQVGLSVGPQAFMRLPVNHGLDISTQEMLHAE